MEVYRLVAVFLLLLALYVSTAQSISCYVCESRSVSKSKSRAKDGCNPGKLGEDMSKESREADEQNNCNYCVTITTHHTDTSEYFSYKRMCGNLGASCKAAKDASLLLTGRLDFSGYSTTTRCCDSGDLCNTNGATTRQMGVLGMLVAAMAILVL